MSTVRKVLWAPDGKCPDRLVKGRPWTEAREITVIDALLGVESEEDCIKACHGIKNLQRQGDISWLEPGKASLLTVYHTKDGPRDMFSQALDAYYRGIPPPEPAKKRGGSPAPIDGVLDFSKFAKGA